MKELIVNNKPEKKMNCFHYNLISINNLRIFFSNILSLCVFLKINILYFLGQF